MTQQGKQRDAVLIWQPYAGMIEPESIKAVHAAQEGVQGLRVVYHSFPTSLLCMGFNSGVAHAKNLECPYFCLVHADIAPSERWLAAMLKAMQEYKLDAIHAPAPIKDNRGLTSTALAYSEDRWQARRRLTVAELRRLPPVFTIEDVQRHIDPDAKALLPNTGCLLMECGEWFRKWEGFAMDDRVAWLADKGKHDAATIPEDWLFGYEAASLGLRVGGITSVQVRHFGKHCWNSRDVWGDASDKSYFEAIKGAKT